MSGVEIAEQVGCLASRDALLGRGCAGFARRRLARIEVRRGGLLRLAGGTDIALAGIARSVAASTVTRTATTIAATAAITATASRPQGRRETEQAAPGMS